jgi:uncharacterized protein
MNNLKSRLQSALLKHGLKVMPVVVVTGARQTGKTTLVRDLFQDQVRGYFTLDRFEILEQAKTNPDSLLEELPVTLDEVQREPGILLAIKRKVDETRQPGMILLTGSANLNLMKSVSESLAGRALYLELPPFCPVEWESGSPTALAPLEALFKPDFHIKSWPTLEGDWHSWLLKGGYPSAIVLENNEDRDLWFSGYVQTYLERDLRDMANVGNLSNFQRMMRLAANRTAKLLNQSEIARDSEIPQPTAHRYLNLLEIGYQITRVPVFSTNPVSSLVKGKKLLWNDCGIAAWLAGIDSEKNLTARADYGFWLEQAIFQSLQTWRSLDPVKRRIYYWRNHLGHEVDFVLETDNEIVAVEIKSGRTVGQKETEGLRAFKAALGRKKSLVRSVVLYGGQEARSLGEEIYALPFAWLFPAAGAKA